jgi:hypothetical protein
MKAIDAFLLRHEVDVGKSFGLLSLARAVAAFYGMVGQLFVGSFNFDLSGPLGFIVGIALWRHSSWARTLLLVIGWASVVIFGVILAVLPFTGTANLRLDVGITLIKNPALWQVYVFSVLLVPVVWFVLSVLHSEKAKSEFRKPNHPPEPAPSAVH